jgi:hypothetical protein
MKDEFGWGKVKGAVSFGLISLAMGIPTVLFYQYGYFDEYDYWAGTVSLVIFAFLETILFTWIFGMNKGWEELNRGADIRIPGVYKWIMKYVTPVLLFFVLMAALVTPNGNDWKTAISDLLSGNGWTLDSSSLLAKITFSDLRGQAQLSPDQSELYEKKMWFTGMARTQLAGLFLLITGIVWYSSVNRKKTKKLIQKH